MKGLEYVAPRPPRIRPCGNLDCRICRHNVMGEAPDSGHPVKEESLASLLLGAAALVLIFAVLFVLVPVLAS